MLLNAQCLSCDQGQVKEEGAEYNPPTYPQRNRQKAVLAGSVDVQHTVDRPLLWPELPRTVQNGPRNELRSANHIPNAQPVARSCG